MGEGFNAWCLETLVEPKTPPSDSPPRRDYLPEFDSIGSTNGYPLNSF